MASEIRVPTLGESVTEATIAQWYKKPGEAVSMDEPLCELETDKVTIEVPAQSAGVLEEVLFEEGATVEVGALLGSIDAEGTPAAPAETPAAEAPTPEPAAPAEPVAPAAPPPPKHKVMRWHLPCGGWSANTGCHRPISRRPAKMVG